MIKTPFNIHQTILGYTGVSVDYINVDDLPYSIIGTESLWIWTYQARESEREGIVVTLSADAHKMAMLTLTDPTGLHWQRGLHRLTPTPRLLQDAIHFKSNGNAPEVIGGIGWQHLPLNVSELNTVCEPVSDPHAPVTAEPPRAQIFSYKTTKGLIVRWMLDRGFATLHSSGGIHMSYESQLLATPRTTKFK